MNWIKNLIFKRRAKKLVATYARDDNGRWLTDKDGKILLKNADPKEIKEAIARNKKQDKEILSYFTKLYEEKTGKEINFKRCGCVDEGQMCPCEKKSREIHPANKKKTSTPKKK
jgi:hypothetical protein